MPRLLRADGWTLITLAEHYGIPADEDIADVEWLTLAGRHGWPVLMKDERIRYRPAERAALLGHGVRSFCLTSGNLSAGRMAELFIAHRTTIWNRAIGAGPAIFTVSSTTVRQIDIDA